MQRLPSDLTKMPKNDVEDSPNPYTDRCIEATVKDISLAQYADKGTLTWFETEWTGNPQPLSAEVWVFSPDFKCVLVVEHRWRGLVPPGGRVEPSETPREGAIRELEEETGLSLNLADRPSFATIRSFQNGWSPTLSLSYWTTADLRAALEPEEDQPARWVKLDDTSRTFHPQDTEIMKSFAKALH